MVKVRVPPGSRSGSPVSPTLVSSETLLAPVVTGAGGSPALLIGILSKGMLVLRTTASWTMVPLFLTTKVTSPAGAVAGRHGEGHGPATLGVTHRHVHRRGLWLRAGRGRNLDSTLERVRPGRAGRARARGEAKEDADQCDAGEDPSSIKRGGALFHSASLYNRPLQEELGRRGLGRRSSLSNDAADCTGTLIAGQRRRTIGRRDVARIAS